MAVELEDVLATVYMDDIDFDVNDSMLELTQAPSEDQSLLLDTLWMPPEQEGQVHPGCEGAAEAVVDLGDGSFFDLATWDEVPRLPAVCVCESESTARGHGQQGSEQQSYPRHTTTSPAAPSTPASWSTGNDLHPFAPTSTASPSSLEHPPGASTSGLPLAAEAGTGKRRAHELIGDTTSADENPEDSPDNVEDGADSDHKRLHRLARNRESAALSRWRKKAKLDAVQRRNEELEAANKQLRYLLSCTHRENQVLRLQIAQSNDLVGDPDAATPGGEQDARIPHHDAAAAVNFTDNPELATLFGHRAEHRPTYAGPAAGPHSLLESMSLQQLQRLLVRGGAPRSRSRSRFLSAPSTPRSQPPSVSPSHASSLSAAATSPAPPSPSIRSAGHALRRTLASHLEHGQPRQDKATSLLLSKALHSRLRSRRRDRRRQRRLENVFLPNLRF